MLEAASSAIEEQIIAALGKPSDLLRVIARPLWERHYRVTANAVVTPFACLSSFTMRLPPDAARLTQRCH